jgi:transposase
MPWVDTEVFQLYLDEVNRVIGGRRIVMVLDNAGWHLSKRLSWGTIEPLNLPAYSPDFNPIERLWLVMKARFFSDWIAKTQDELTERVVNALRSFMASPDDIKSVCSIGN